MCKIFYCDKIVTYSIVAIKKISKKIQNIV